MRRPRESSNEPHRAFTTDLNEERVNGALNKMFNQNSMKLILALAIPTGLISFWLYAQHEAKVDVDQYKEEQKEHPNSNKIQVENYELKEIDDNNTLKWRLMAMHGESDPETKDVDLTEVNVDYFDGKKIKMRLSAPTGLANEATKKVELRSTSARRVTCEGEEGKSELAANKVELMKKNQFAATGGVNIVWPGVAKVTGDRAEGSLANTDLNNLKVIGHTHASIGGQQGK